MPIEPYQRGQSWWARGRVEYNGVPITGYYRRSTGASSEAGAWQWCREEEERQVRRHLLGEDSPITFAEAVILYPAKPKEAGFLMKILPEIGETACAQITPRQVRALAPRLYPEASTDTWLRQVITPIKAVINNAHEEGKCPPIKIKAYSTAERVAQDKARNKQSRQEKKPGSWEWIDQFSIHAGPYLAALAEFMFETGARIGQAVALRPQDIDMKNLRVMLPASKGHPAQWVSISPEMAIKLANLPPRRPKDRRRGTVLAPKVFGYAGHNGPLKAWKTACKKAGIDYLPPHSAGRHGFYTELRVRQGLDPITAAKAGRWSNPALPDRIYAHNETPDSEVRTMIRTSRVQRPGRKSLKAMKGGKD
ncbi:tyrosine-type recombinase/integrase [Paracoccus denitrificans]|uniref:tyrosine-type recombinase/integrase n=1 Tax=Paracoccus denitrificans TaxID=266 RepID=UPI001E417541|nr:tyrosine-type recombinase/integrase [Paracoccus denitrificans]UFS65313.1 tyrosine-type recombinase/integrase [Paracoccus denitrificans]